MSKRLFVLCIALNGLFLVPPQSSVFAVGVKDADGPNRSAACKEMMFSVLGPKDPLTKALNNDFVPELLDTSEVGNAVFEFAAVRFSGDQVDAVAISDFRAWLSELEVKGRVDIKTSVFRFDPEFGPATEYAQRLAQGTTFVDPTDPESFAVLRNAIKPMLDVLSAKTPEQLFVVMTQARAQSERKLTPFDFFTVSFVNPRTQKILIVRSGVAVETVRREKLERVRFVAQGREIDTDQWEQALAAREHFYNSRVCYTGPSEAALKELKRLIRMDRPFHWDEEYLVRPSLSGTTIVATYTGKDIESFKIRIKRCK